MKPIKQKRCIIWSYEAMHGFVQYMYGNIRNYIVSYTIALALLIN